MKSVLLLEAYLIQTQAIAKSLHKAGYRVVSFCEEKNSYGYHTKYVDEKHITIPCEGHQEEYYQLLLDFLKKNTVSAIIPMSDESAKMLAQHQDEIAQFSAIACPPFESFIKGYDKNQLMKVCEHLGIEHPLTIDLSEPYDLTKMKYPAIIKPNITSGGRGMRIVENEEELKAIIPQTIKEYGNCHVQEYIPQGGRQIKVQLLVDRNMSLVCSSVMQKTRWYPVKGGSSCCNITIEEPELVEACYSILKQLNWRGFADFDVIEDPRTSSLNIMEMNPRVPACIKSAIVSGINWGEIIVSDILCQPQKNYEYDPGHVLRFLGFDFLWFLKSKDRHHTSPSWYSFFGRKVHYQDLDWTDFGSFFWGTYGNIRKLFSSDFRESKAGLN